MHNDDKNLYREAAVYGAIIASLLTTLQEGSVKNFIFDGSSTNSTISNVINTVGMYGILVLLSYIIGVFLVVIVLYLEAYLSDHFTRVPIEIQTAIITCIIIAAFIIIQ